MTSPRSFLQLFQDSLFEHPSLLIEGLWDSPKALLVALAKKTLKQHIVIITGSNRSDQLYENLSYFLGKPPLQFPSWETLPGEGIKPSPDIVGKRYQILHQLFTAEEPQIILTPLQGILQKVIPPAHLLPSFHHWKKGEDIPFDTIPQLLISLGYEKRPVASDKGGFAVRGSIIDIFPISAFDPYRIDFFGDTIENIYTFDPISQKSIKKQQEVFISPADEFNSIKKEEKSTLFLDYLNDQPLLIFDDLLTIEDKYIALKNLPGAISPLFLSFEEFLQLTQNHKQLFLTEQSIESLTENVKREQRNHVPIEHVSFEIFQKQLQTKRLHHPFLRITDYFDGDLLNSIDRDGKEFSLTFLTASVAEENSLREKIQNMNLSSAIFKRGYLSSGYLLVDTKEMIFPYTELSKRQKISRQQWRSTYHTPASDFHELLPGDLVVHIHNGIGKYLGIEKQKNHLGYQEEFFIIEYANNSKLFTPLTQSHLISRYIGTHEETPTLHTLGTKSWSRAKEKAQTAIIGYAHDLLQMQASREMIGGFSYTEDSDHMILFEEEFPFEETADQLNAIADTKRDMCSLKAMDRLICGDVGYGKTEIAMRAAFKAVVDGGRQVAILVPTTILAMQHLETFCTRMAEFPITIRALSRFVKGKVINETLNETKAGKVDILIGTHRIISKDVQFKNLGLIIIDEEQRFGVRAKEHLKKLKTGVDCLTLSATPIPRTLYFSLVGARDMSVINTPPQDRLPIKTILAEWDQELIKNALLRELTHDGQAFFIHNRVETIYKVADDLKKLIPSSRTAVVHGQMSPGEIDSVFHSFKTGEFNILVATTIVENGIDIPNANTILIDRADHYGLADLYQLRGRVGRWNKPAYAYFLTPKNRELPEVSQKRLQALVESSGLGGGMKLAMRDLEIRGAGDFLGMRQSGNVSTIGFHLYCKLLKQAIKALKKKKPTPFFETKMEFSFDANLPETYIPETSLRLEIYHRLGEITTVEEADEILSELEDRFGPAPKQVYFFYHLTRLRIIATECQVSLMQFKNHTLTIRRSEGSGGSVILPQFKSPQELESHVSKLLRLA